VGTLDFFQVFRGAAKIVVADDPLGLAEAGNGPGRVFLQVHVLHAGHNRAAEQHPALIFAAGETAAVLGTAHGDDDRAGAVVDQAIEAYPTLEVVQPQFEQLRSLFGHVFHLGPEHPVPPATNTHTDHGNVPLFCVLRSDDGLRIYRPAQETASPKILYQAPPLAKGLLHPAAADSGTRLGARDAPASARRTWRGCLPRSATRRLTCSGCKGGGVGYEWSS